MDLVLHGAALIIMIEAEQIWRELFFRNLNIREGIGNF